MAKKGDVKTRKIKDDELTIGTVLIIVRKCLNLIQEDLAYNLQVSKETISRLENGIIKESKVIDNLKTFIEYKIGFDDKVKIIKQLICQMRKANVVGVDSIIQEGEDIIYKYESNNFIEDDDNLLRFKSFFESVIDFVCINGDASNNKDFEPFRQYMSDIKKSYATFTMIGKEERPLSMDDLYIRLCVNGREGSELFEAEDLVERKETLSVVLGIPGMGKTTMMQRLMYKECNRVPIFIKLQTYSTCVHNGRLMPLSEYVMNEMKRLISDDIVSFIDFNKLLVLLDGLDEVKKGVYNTVLHEINDFTIKCNQCRVILTSRNAGFEKARAVLHQRVEYEISELTLDKIENFIYEWFQPDKELAKELYERLAEGHKQHKNIAQLAKNPFLLSTICIVYQNKRTLPEGRFELYKECITNLFELFNRREGVGRYETILDDLNEVFTKVAYQYFENNDYESGMEKLIPKIKDLYPDAHEFIKMACEYSILCKINSEKYEFFHRTFYEYYVSRYLFENKIDILSHVDDARWEEPIRLYSAQINKIKDGTDFFESLWDKKRDLALRCYQDMTGVIEADFIKKLLNKTTIDEKVTLIKGLKAKLEDDKVIETLQVILDEKNGKYFETNGEVLYWTVETLKQFGDKADNIIKQRFGTEEEITARRSALIQKHFGTLERHSKDTKPKDNMVKIPGGIFDMGSPEGEAERFNNESLHKVELSPFYMSKFTVTNALYKEFDPNHKSYTEYADHPVTNVNWYEATMFCQWLGCKLPTEAQWEYACRGEENMPYNTGETITKKQANYNSDKPVPVNSFIPNQYGLYNMYGNVWEWCEDWYGKYNCEEMEVNPTGPQSGSGRVLRGGSFIGDAGYCRSACRGRNHPGYRYHSIGFRLVCSPQFGGSL